MRRMLDQTKVGGIPSTIEFDKEGNRKVKKNLGVDGKLTLTSLVSSTNPDGDITKELGGGGGNLYIHCIKLTKITRDINIFVNFYSKNNEKVNTIDLLKKYLLGASGMTCSGYIKVDNHYGIFNSIDTISTSLVAYYIDMTDWTKDRYYLSNVDSITDTILPVI